MPRSGSIAAWVFASERPSIKPWKPGRFTPFSPGLWPGVAFTNIMTFDCAKSLGVRTRFKTPAQGRAKHASRNLSRDVSQWLDPARRPHEAGTLGRAELLGACRLPLC